MNVIRPLAIALLSLSLLDGCSSDADPDTASGGAGGRSASGGSGQAGSAGKASAAGSANGGGGSADNGSAGNGSAGNGSAGNGSAGNGSAGAAGGGSKLGLNDVSYLFPIPKTEAELKSLLTFASSGAHGALFPRAVYDTFITHLTELNAADESYAWSRVIAMRLDPCAGRTTASKSEPCRAEVRLTTQLTNEAGGYRDGGVHLIYSIAHTELREMLTEILALKPKTDGDLRALPLGPHPILVEQGLSGEFAIGLKSAILKHVGGDRLVKVTTVIAGRSLNDWFFEQFEKQASGKFTNTVIPTTQAMVTGFDEFSNDPTVRDTRLHDIDQKVGFPYELANNASAKKLGPAQLKAALNRLTQLEDPNEHSSNTVDCVSCHLVTARGFYEKLTGVQADPSFESPNGLNLTRLDETALSGFNTRAFGYLRDRVSVSQRVINESARVISEFENDVK